MLIPSFIATSHEEVPSLSRRVNANSQLGRLASFLHLKLIKKGEC